MKLSHCEAAQPPQSLWPLSLGLLLLVTACASPEATRTRGGGPGADIGNRKAVVQFHAGADQYFGTPCLTHPLPCRGPLPVFGRTSAPD
jgi:hypothetical protein